MRAAASIIGICAVAALFAQRPSPAPVPTRSILVKGGTVHVGDGRTFDDGAVGFRNGTIDYVGYGYGVKAVYDTCLLYTSPSPRDRTRSRMPSSA